MQQVSEIAVLLPQKFTLALRRLRQINKILERSQAAFLYKSRCGDLIVNLADQGHVPVLLPSGLAFRRRSSEPDDDYLIKTLYYLNHDRGPVVRKVMALVENDQTASNRLEFINQLQG